MFAELVELLRKLHETFIALAAQLHQVHEAVKVWEHIGCTFIIEITMCYCKSTFISLYFANY